MLEKSIKFFLVNENDDLDLYMVFELLLTEKVFLSMNNIGTLVGITYLNSEVIPIFSRPERLEEYTFVNREVKVYIETPDEKDGGFENASSF